MPKSLQSSKMANLTSTVEVLNLRIFAPKSDQLLVQNQKIIIRTRPKQFDSPLDILKEPIQAMTIPTANIFQMIPELTYKIACRSADQPICLNQGFCVDWALLHPIYQPGNEECLCQNRYYGPRCEFDVNVIFKIDEEV